MANPSSLPLCEKIQLKRNTQTVLDITIFFLLLSLLCYRMLFFFSHGFSWLQAVAFLCEFWFTFVWTLIVAIKWNPVHFKTYPDRLLTRDDSELPPVDLFVVTADAALEPPIITVNTVLSVLAVDYPADKLACYVSDDGCSPLTYYSLAEALKFAQIWVPFCKKYNVQLRAPFKYFSGASMAPPSGGCTEFQREWNMIKDEYEELSHRIEEAEKTNGPRDLAEVFSNVKSNNHPAIIKVLWENKKGVGNGLPLVVYVSREKTPNHPHNFKAGAQNVLTRVSGVMTNAPYLLSVDCDMFVNNPNMLLHAISPFLESGLGKEIAFTQFPQYFHNTSKDDPYGNQYIIFLKHVLNGIADIQGPVNMGTGCVFRRKALYGQSPEDGANTNGKKADDELVELYGNSEDFFNSAACALMGITDNPKEWSKCIEAANKLASSSYEFNTDWGSKLGWLYGTATEDVLIGLNLHKKGWKSVYITPDPPAFLGCAPTSIPVSLIQQKRWTTGFLEIFFSRNSPILATGKLQFRQRMAYAWLLTWALRSIPELCYAALPAYCLIVNSHFLPKAQEPAGTLPYAAFVFYNLQQLLLNLEVGQSVRAWWNNQRMGRVNTMCSWLFGLLGFLLKLLGLSETTFELTKKDSSSSDDADADSWRFTFTESSMFVPGTTILLIHLTALLMGLLGLRPPIDVGEGFGLGEVICSVWLVICFWPFAKGLFHSGRYGLPLSTIWKSAALTLMFVYLCQRATTG